MLANHERAQAESLGRSRSLIVFSLRGPLLKEVKPIGDPGPPICGDVVHSRLPRPADRSVASIGRYALRVGSREDFRCGAPPKAKAVGWSPSCNPLPQPPPQLPPRVGHAESVAAASPGADSSVSNVSTDMEEVFMQMQMHHKGLPKLGLAQGKLG